MSTERCRSQCGPNRSESLLLPHPISVSRARLLVRDLITGSGRADLVDDAQLLVSEVVTNAVIHAGTSIRFRCSVDERSGLRVEVRDGSPHHPALRDYADTAGTGRGMSLLAELADEWGVVADAGGKTVWFDLGGTTRRPPGTRQAPPGEASYPTVSRSAAGGAALTVQLLQMPLLLHEAWREHAETLLREYLLVSLGTFDFEGADGSIRASRADHPTHSSTVQDPIRVHAAAMDALALLEEQVPDADIDMNPEQLMATATEPRVTTARVHVRMPRASVPHFATLDRALAATVDLVGSGQVMAPKTQPEIQAFGRWVCGEVDWQSAGRQPVPWVLDRDSSAPGEVGAVPVHGDVTTSSKAVVAADDTNQIIAISAAAVTLLGYDAAEELVGRRLIAIIPPRFQQAHIAGFTLYALVGRAPLLDREVVVPALRRNGSEVEVRLTVTAHDTADGPRSFVATLLPVT